MAAFNSRLPVVEVVDKLAKIVLDVPDIDRGSPNDLSVVHTASLIIHVHSNVLVVLLQLLNLRQTKSRLICC
jgi:hypothetical protein